MVGWIVAGLAVAGGLFVPPVVDVSLFALGGALGGFPLGRYLGGDARSGRLAALVWAAAIPAALLSFRGALHAERWLPLAPFSIGALFVGGVLTTVVAGLATRDALRFGLRSVAAAGASSLVLYLVGTVLATSLPRGLWAAGYIVGGGLAGAVAGAILSEFEPS